MQGGILLGSSGIARTAFGYDYLFPPKTIMTLETVANLGLLFYMFLVGLEVDIKPISQTSKKALTISIAGFLLPFPVGYALHYMLVGDDIAAGRDAAMFGPVFWGLALSTTNFSDLAMILEDLKLLHTEIGRTALSASVVTDGIAWVLLVVVVSTIKDMHVYTVVLGSAFVIFSLLALRPAISWFIQRHARAQYEDSHICFVLTGVVACGYITDACGCHSILGGFMLGLIIPKGELKRVLMEKVEDFISGILLPLFFLITGLRTNRQDILHGQLPVITIIGVIVLAFVVKIISTFVAAVFFNKMTPRDGLTLGLLMNTKGLLALIVINSARNEKILDNRTFTIIIATLWLMTVGVVPIVTLTHRCFRHSEKFSHKSLISLQPDSELRVLTCFHSSHEVTGIIKLLDASNPTKQSPLLVFAIHLIENSGRAATMLIVHDACRINVGGDDKDNELLDSSQHVAAAAFDGFKNGKEGVKVQPLTTVSAYATMHEDICNLAEENHTSIIILPFQLNATNSGLGASPRSFNSHHLRSMNKKVMEKSPCSVAVLVDRGHRLPPASDATSSSQVGHHFMVLFIGGPDDREALAYAERMSGSRIVALTVMRFIAADYFNSGDDDMEEKEKSLDDQYFEGFLQKTSDNPLVNVGEAVVNSVEEVVKALGTMEEEYDLVIVGKGRRSSAGQSASKMLEGTEWSDYPELGLLGDALVCSTIAARAWILIVQQGGSGGSDICWQEQEMDNDSGILEEELGHMAWQPFRVESPDLAPFVSRSSSCR
ncbi:cation/H(+) antiporter 15-like [Humulus lupulus]|uniref:cation/H(+) antiporter 15-like n=1 Tax=Humulus lupulus TaxID=3486 RepID=UPI002B413209|nr:cation/H(+) antiporter 15-like [Humulus lupulus]